VISGYAERDGSYLTNFFYFQPALNYGFARPEPKQPWQQPVDAPGPQRTRLELKNIIRYWLEQGASGFRVDMAFSLVKSDPGELETSRLWQDIRHWLDQKYPEACLVSEWGRPRIAIQAGFHVDFCLPFGMPGYVALLRKPYTNLGPGTDRYSFAYFDSAGHGNIREFLDDYLAHYEQTKGRGLIAIPTGNHDTGPRLAQGRSPADLELIYLFLMSMPGVPFIYYGDEIGMQSIEGLPSKEGAYNRTGIRTPMQWADVPNAGFSTAPVEKLYLPIDNRLGRPTAAAQEADPESLLQRVRKLIALHAHPALCASGDFEVVHAQGGDSLFVYRRSKGDESILIAINPAAHPVELTLPFSLPAAPHTLYGVDGAIRPEADRWVLRLPGASGGAYLLA
jgi:maltose alpha-D-glucosyltransferase/alpha-amylase